MADNEDLARTLENVSWPDVSGFKRDVAPNSPFAHFSIHSLSAPPFRGTFITRVSNAAEKLKVRDGLRCVSPLQGSRIYGERYPGLQPGL